jgi:signal transduction histidine kinase
MAVIEQAKSTAVANSLKSRDEDVYVLNALLADVAGQLIRVTVDEIDEEINRCLKRIGTDFGLDRSTIAQINPKTRLADFTHGWARHPYRLIRRPLDANRLLPWSVQKMLDGETVAMSNPYRLPAEASVDRASFLRYGPKSNVIVPIKVGGSVIGCISFASLRLARSWPAQTVRAFERIAEIFGFGLERKRVVAETLRLRNELNYVARVSMMGELAASMAHELNQPLGAILSNAEALQAMLASEIPDLEEIRAAIADIIQDDTRARDTILRVWALFRRSEVTKLKLDLDELLSGISRIVRTDASLRNISFKIDVKPPVPAVSGESVQLQQAILNLVLNAFDAVANIDDGPREVCVEASAGEGGSSVEVRVHDTGAGIAAEAMAHIFEPFVTTKTKGMGMGLAIAKSIIEAHRGTLSIVSSSDRGSTFEIRLPITEHGIS